MCKVKSNEHELFQLFRFAVILFYLLKQVICLLLSIISVTDIIVHCILQYLPIFFSELKITPLISISPDAVVVEGERVHIMCNVTDYSKGDLEVFLTKDSLLYKDHWKFSHSFVVTPNDTGEYVCKTERGNVQKSSKAQLKVVGNYS